MNKAQEKYKIVHQKEIVERSKLKNQIKKERTALLKLLTPEELIQLVEQNNEVDVK